MSDPPRPRRRASWLRLFTPMTRGAARAVVFLFLLSLIIGGLNFLWTARAVNGAEARARALCQFDAHLGAVPVTPVAATGKASLLGVKLVSDARIAFRQAGCTGQLPPPDPSFLRWAAYYHLPAG